MSELILYFSLCVVGSSLAGLLIRWILKRVDDENPDEIR